jgi:hypothetical protein
MAATGCALASGSGLTAPVTTSTAKRVHDSIRDRGLPPTISIVDGIPRHHSLRASAAVL